MKITVFRHEECFHVIYYFISAHFHQHNQILYYSISFQEYLSKRNTHPVFYGDLIYIPTYFITYLHFMYKLVQLIVSKEHKGLVNILTIGCVFPSDEHLTYCIFSEKHVLSVKVVDDISLRSALFTLISLSFRYCCIN